MSAAISTPLEISSDAILEITKRLIGITCTLFSYRFLQFLTSPLIFLYFLLRLLRRPEYRTHFRERLGWLPEHFARERRGAIWLHAVSVGEVASALPLLRELRERLPGTPLYLSTSTVPGRRIAEQQTAAIVDGIFYAPLDFVSCVRRTLRRLRPALLVILETEIWPNLLFQTRLSGASIAVVNGRISDRAWSRYRGLRKLFQPILKLPDAVLVQSALDLERFVTLGAVYRKVSVEPNLKYDAAAFPTPARDIPTFDASHIWIAASTVGPNERGQLHRHAIVEEQIVIETFRRLAPEFPGLLLILAPRQPSRFKETARLLQSSEVPFVQRSRVKTHGDASLRLPGVLLLDSLGELAGLYPQADVVFVGGSLAPRGGHNILEPALAGAPIIVGPHMQNFESIYRDFRHAGAIVEVDSGSRLFAAVRFLLSDRERARELGARGMVLAQSQAGVSKRVARRMVQLHSLGQFRSPRPLPLRFVLGTLALLWEAGGRRKRHRAEQLASQRSPLGPPAISVGGITVGGSGKTPFADYLATSLHQRGYRPALLTRGYRRRCLAKYIVASPGARLPTSFTGDEAQIFLRSAKVPVGIGADRYQAGRLLLSHYPETNALVLDDGFQHARLKREIDIVVIDGLNPLGGNQVVPLGRLREPLTTLHRAAIFVVTRAQSPEHLEAITERLREWNAHAPVFAARLEIFGWRNLFTGETVTVEPGRRVAAFCGLGNPLSFWRTLAALKLDVVLRAPFEDHHSYKPAELRLLRHSARTYGADLLVTTEKDRANLPANSAEAFGSIEVNWLEIGLSVNREDEFFRELESRLGRH